METMKCVVVGDEGVGKSALLLSCIQDTLPQEYIPRVIDNFIVQVFVGDRPTSIILWDTAGNEEYDGIRRLMYSQVDVFLLCFSVINRASLDNVLHKWLEEIRNFSEEGNCHT